MRPLGPEQIAAAYRAACRAELDALKPGNVHRFAEGHGMTVADFEASAAVSAGPLAAAGASVGRRVLEGVRATRARVGQNTNLGILLLCAPLAAAAERGGATAEALEAVLAGLTAEDAADVFAAIRLAAPGGLGTAERHDVAEPPTVGLRTAMAAAAGRDRIARAYADGFRDVLTVGLPALAAARAAGLDPARAASAAYLAYLARFPDTHIARKHGSGRADAVRRDAAALLVRLDGAPDPEAALLAFDAALKREGLNPGTSADLTVAALFADRLDHERKFNESGG